MWPFVLVTLVVVVLVVLLRGAPELARLEVRRGKLLLTRGRLPARLLGDFADILADPAIESAGLRIVVEDGRPRLLARGLDEASQQRLRNVLGSYTVAQIRAGQRTAG